MVSPKDKQTMRSARNPWGTATCVYPIRRAKTVVSTDPPKKHLRVHSHMSEVTTKIYAWIAPKTNCYHWMHYFTQWPDFMQARVSRGNCSSLHNQRTSSQWALMSITYPIVGFSASLLFSFVQTCLKTQWEHWIESCVPRQQTNMAEKEEVVGWLVGWGRGKRNGRGRRWVGVGVVNTTFSLHCSLSQALVCLSRSHCSQSERPFQSNPAFLCNQHIGRACPHFSHH